MADDEKDIYGPVSRRQRDSVIEIRDYDPTWPARFAEEALRLASALGTDALRIEHLGSTAVPGLAAKPVIDIQVSVAKAIAIHRGAVGTRLHAFRPGRL